MTDDLFNKITDEEFNRLQDKHLQERLASLDVLNAWFTERMMDDVWYFGLVLTNGDVLGIRTIEKIRQDKNGTIWIDALMLAGEDTVLYLKHHPFKGRLILAPAEREYISINASHIMYAVELYGH